MSQFWEGKRVFVTGATGLIGSWLTKALLDYGAQVTALVEQEEPQGELYRSGAINRVEVIKGKLEDFAILERAIGDSGAETVFHLAAQAIVPVAHQAPLPTFEANIRGTYHVLEACRLHQRCVRRVVLASSDKAYGEHGTSYHEDLALNARHPYEVSKACGELLARSYYHTFGVPLAIARCGNVYGGSDLNWSRLIPATIRALLLNEPLVLRSNGQFVRDYFYVKDAAEAYLALAEQLHRPDVQGEAFNFSKETPLTVLEVVEIVRRLLGVPPVEPVILGTAEGELVSQWLSAKKAHDVLGWQARWDLKEGLAETIEWYRGFFATAGAVR